MTGFSSPTMPTVPALSRASPVNQQTKASAVATRLKKAKPATAGSSSAGGAPSTTRAASSRPSPPASNCQAVTASTGVSSFHRLAST